MHNGYADIDMRQCSCELPFPKLANGDKSLIEARGSFVLPSNRPNIYLLFRNQKSIIRIRRRRSGGGDRIYHSHLYTDRARACQVEMGRCGDQAGESVSCCPESETFPRALSSCNGPQYACGKALQADGKTP